MISISYLWLLVGGLALVLFGFIAGRLSASVKSIWLLLLALVPSGLGAAQIFDRVYDFFFDFIGRS
jgi:hypothetical protein